MTFSIKEELRFIQEYEKFKDARARWQKIAEAMGIPDRVNEVKAYGQKYEQRSCKPRQATIIASKEVVNAHVQLADNSSSRIHESLDKATKLHYTFGVCRASYGHRLLTCSYIEERKSSNSNKPAKTHHPSY